MLSATRIRLATSSCTRRRLARFATSDVASPALSSPVALPAHGPARALPALALLTALVFAAVTSPRAEQGGATLYAAARR